MIDELVTLAQRGGAAGGRARDGAPRAARRPRPQPRPPRRVDHGRVRGSAGARACEGRRGDPARWDRRRQVPLRRGGHVHDPPTASRSRSASTRTRATSSSSIPWSRAALAPRRRSRSGPSLEHTAGAGRSAAPPRRRRVPGPGRGRRDAEPPGAGGLLDRRHRPHHHRQPGGLHDRPDGGSLDALRLRHGEGLQRADHPRQRRRRRGLHRGDPPRDGLSRALGPRHRHRPDRLPPLRAQRDRRARLHPAD